MIASQKYYNLIGVQISVWVLTFANMCIMVSVVLGGKGLDCTQK